MNTLFAGSMEHTMAWRVEEYLDGDIVDCVIWAGDSADVGVVMESGCREISF